MWRCLRLMVWSKMLKGWITVELSNGIEVHDFHVSTSYVQNYSMGGQLILITLNNLFQWKALSNLWTTGPWTETVNAKLTKGHLLVVQLCSILFWNIVDLKLRCLQSDMKLLVIVLNSFILQKKMVKIISINKMNKLFLSSIILLYNYSQEAKRNHDFKNQQLSNFFSTQVQMSNFSKSRPINLI